MNEKLQARLEYMDSTIVALIDSVSKLQVDNYMLKQKLENYEQYVATVDQLVEDVNSIKFKMEDE